MICSAEGCEREVFSRQFCRHHYRAQWERGDFKKNPAKRGTKPTPAIVRLMSRMSTAPGPLPTDCWVSTYATAPNGYVYIGVGSGPKVLVHRLCYEHHVGPIPSGLHLDHLCRVTTCFNPAHLEPVTPGENLRRSDNPSAVAHRTGICKRGHSRADAYVNGACRSCRRELRTAS